jgi:hypothetical protein
MPLPTRLVRLFYQHDTYARVADDDVRRLEMSPPRIYRVGCGGRASY